jgi:predicted DNA-binding transcriptional regulator AlpA
MTKFLRYPTLVARGIVRNRMTLKRWIDKQGFPPGFLMGPNTRVWPEDEVDAWLKARADERASRRVLPAPAEETPREPAARVAGAAEETPRRLECEPAAPSPEMVRPCR